MKSTRSPFLWLMTTAVMLGCGGDAGSALDAYRSRLNPDAISPKFSPDGSRIGFVATVGGEAAIFVSGPRMDDAVRLSFGIWDYPPYWSPDGRWIAFDRDIGVGDIGDIFIKPTDGGDEIPLAVTDAAERMRGWLPDGSAVLYGKNDQVWVGPIDGGEPHRLLDIEDDYFGVPSPDGTRVAYVRSVGSLQTVWLYDTRTGEHRQITTDGFEALGETPWSPDGTKFIFVSSSTGTRDVWVVDAASQTTRQVTRHLGNDYGPTWSPDGAWIAFVSDRGGQTDIWIAASNGNGTPIRVTDGPRVESGLNWDPDGSRLIFNHAASEILVGIVGLAGTDPHTVFSARAADVDFHLSPDGTTIVFTSSRSGNQDLWTVPVEGGEPRRMTRNPLPDINGKWSPDGQSISFQSRRNGNWDIFTMAANGEDQVRLTDWPESERLRGWSPDGARIAFVSNHESDGQDVWIVPASGGTPTRLTSLDGDVGTVAWNPDGSQIVFVEQSSPSRSTDVLYSVSSSGGPVSELFAGDILGVPAWSPDGEYISLAITRDGYTRLHVVPATGGVPRRVTNGEREWDWGANWSADGNEIVFTRQILSGKGLLQTAAVNVADGTVRTILEDSVRPFTSELSPGRESVLYVSREADAPVDEVRIAELLAGQPDAGN